MRCRVKAKATRDVSIVIHRRPHFSATNAVVPEPHVGSITRSPGSVDMSKQRSITLGLVCTTYSLSPGRPAVIVSVQRDVYGIPWKSSMYRTYDKDALRGDMRLARRSRSIPASLVDQRRCRGGRNLLLSSSTGNQEAAP